MSNNSVSFTVLPKSHLDLSTNDDCTPTAKTDAGDTSAQSRAMPTKLAGLPPNRLKKTLSYPEETTMVKTSTMQKLRLAAQVIETVEQHFPHGSGNQWPSIVQSEGESFARADFNRELMEQHVRAGKSLPTFKRARAAIMTQGGNCGEMAAVAYTEVAARGLDAPVFRAIYEKKHTVVLLGDSRESSRDTVVVDAWPHFPTATTLNHSKLRSGELEILERRSQAKPSEVAKKQLAEISHTPKEDINEYLSFHNYPTIGPALVRNLNERSREMPAFDVRTLVSNPTVLYVNEDDAVESASFDNFSEDQMRAKQDSIEKYELLKQDPSFFGDSDNLVSDD